MNIEVWILYVLTILVMMITPGPSQILIMSNSAAFGFKRSLATTCGDLSANMLQMLAAALGVGALVVSSPLAFSVIQWLGVGYLVWRALSTLRSTRAVELNKRGCTTASLKTLYLQGFITSAANPKAVIFFSALFPQFIALEHNFWIQFGILAATYITIDGCFLSFYALSVQWLIALFNPKSTLWINRTGGSLMLLAAILLAFKSL